MMKRITRIGGFIFLILRVSLMPAEVVVKVPGSFSKFISYMQSYSATEENLIYQLSETLLFEQMPDFDDIMKAVLQETRVYKPKEKVDYSGFKHKRNRKGTGGKNIKLPGYIGISKNA